MRRGESEAHGAQASATRAQGREAGPRPESARDAAARFLDAWERNQAEIARLGPPPGPRAER